MQANHIMQNNKTTLQANSIIQNNQQENDFAWYIHGILFNPT